MIVFSEVGLESRTSCWGTDALLCTEVVKVSLRFKIQCYVGDHVPFVQWSDLGLISTPMFAPSLLFFFKTFCFFQIKWFLMQMSFVEMFNESNEIFPTR